MKALLFLIGEVVIFSVALFFEYIVWLWFGDREGLLFACAIVIVYSIVANLYANHIMYDY